MKLGALLSGLPGLELGAQRDLEISALAYDSRRVVLGTLFFAIQGEKADGHQYVSQALEQGATAIVSELKPPAGLAPRWIQVSKIRRALSHAGHNFYHQPDSRLKLVGITGTNGKTTTAFLIESILRAAGIPSGLFGTIEYRLGDRTVTAGNTTPESLDLLTYFDELLKGGAKAAVMEVSSHALAQERVWEFQFAAAVFTNLTQDHLDYHKDFESYFAAKRRLFEGLGTNPPALAVINANDPWGGRLLGMKFARLLTFGMNSNAEVKVGQFAQSASGIQATMVIPGGTIEIKSPLLGRANMMNILAATATAIGLEVDTKPIQAGIASLECVPGRFERVVAGQPFLVLVDYAHTDDALRNVLKTARELTRNRLIVVFGCGGDRDRAKRPLMGEVAGTLSDLAVLTSDNPRSEDPLRIMSDAMVGLQKSGRPYLAEEDREKAIRTALERAHEGDVVVLAGKGHETYQILKDRTIPFDDHEVARRMLREMGYRGNGKNGKTANRVPR
ncbi:MAG TPA: UDP-N-acetylmuramoyl-L-alanyl-D-glutamate--2,6-diaminopimelate ligase [Terriglobia bacterium]|nr:UDP-N-acetylmuramoyl-L-alanyl-D-glutamate--2,6-diaminopimelate ligase [Terriglobia bacterium]